MTRQEAKRILLLYRPHGPDAEDPALTEALALAARDPELKDWLDRHLAAQAALRRKFRSLAVPPDLADRILAAPKVTRMPRWNRVAVPWLAAAILVLLGLVAALIVLNQPSDRFENFQSRMVSSVLREYRMDIATNELAAVRRYMDERQAPSTFEIPPGLQTLSLTGGGLLRWRNHPVSMICYDRGTNQMVFLFVMNRQAPRDPPPAAPHLESVNKLVTASWSRGDWLYFMAGEDSAAFPERFLPKP